MHAYQVLSNYILSKRFGTAIYILSSNFQDTLCLFYQISVSFHFICQQLKDFY